MKLTQGQWDTISPDYKREKNDKKYILMFEENSTEWKLESVEIVDIPPVVCIPEHYKNWPLDPRD